MLGLIVITLIRTTCGALGHRDRTDLHHVAWTGRSWVRPVSCARCRRSTPDRSQWAAHPALPDLAPRLPGPVRRRIAAAAVAATAVLLTGCGNAANMSGHDADTSTDPRKGWVRIGTDGYQDVSKHCDGSTLIYLSAGAHQGGIAVVTGSPECAP